MRTQDLERRCLDGRDLRSRMPLEECSLGLLKLWSGRSHGSCIQLAAPGLIYVALRLNTHGTRNSIFRFYQNRNLPSRYGRTDL